MTKMKHRQAIQPVIIIAFVVITGLMACSTSGPRERSSFNTGWRFSLAASDDAWKGDFDDTGWRLLDLPHDWSIEGEFSESNPAGAGGGALPGGTGWYRKTFKIDPSKKDKLIYIEFDGVYRNSEVWINGNYLGIRPYGYSSFRYELTPYLSYGDEMNVLAVKVDNSKQPNSRWYSGSGIYRNVWLVSTEKIAVDHWGTFVTASVISKDSARIMISAAIRNSTGSQAPVTVASTVFNPGGQKVAMVKNAGINLADTVTVVTQEVTLKDPSLWSVEKPDLYRVVTEVMSGGKVFDRYETVTGIRSFAFDSEKGFILNGKHVRILGVCNHHDLGCLGAAVNTRAIERQLELLKEMGCNGIRTSHNPPAPELLDLCDRMGFIVMDEAFDMWKIKKTDFDYSLDYDEWHKRDLEDMVLRDRNHPSVFIWSIGNEIMEQRDTTLTGIPMAKELAGIVRALDNTRPITSACNDPTPHNPIIASGALDLIGFNYHDTLWADFPKVFPGKKFIGTETTSALATRGSYDMPSGVIRRWPARWNQPFKDSNPDLTCSAYDNCSAPWGSTHEESWKLIKKYDFLSGMFIWTGFDYLGEPTPYSWPARSSYFGIIDLAGFPKDAYYMYQSEWTDKPVLHIFPHWNWAPGQIVDVWAYTNCDEVELFINGNTLGRQKKTEEKMHLVWPVKFEAGTLTGIGYKNGAEVMRQQVMTAGAPAAIVLAPDRSEITADGSDLSFITVLVVDKHNVTVPYAENLVKFSIEGDGTITGVDNGSQTSMEPFKADFRKAFHGKCLLVVKAGTKEGMIRVKAYSEGLTAAGVDVHVR
jgi:beta-galactosidase